MHQHHTQKLSTGAIHQRKFLPHTDITDPCQKHKETRRAKHTLI